MNVQSLNQGVRRPRSSFGAVIMTVWKNRSLAGEMIHRDIRERYISQALSWAWLFVQPALTTTAYIVVFAYVFNARIGTDSSRAGYVVFLLSGLLAWMAVSEVMVRAVTAVSGVPGFVKQMVFPVEVLPLKIFGSPALSFLFSSAIFLVYVSLNGRGDLFLLFGWPFSVLCLVTFLVGTSYLLSAIGVFLRDIRDIVQVYTTIGLFASPTLFSVDAAPYVLKLTIALNPVTPFILMFQDSVVGGAPIHVVAWLAGPLFALATLLAGLAIFTWLRPVMGDVL